MEPHLQLRCMFPPYVPFILGGRRERLFFSVCVCVMERKFIVCVRLCACMNIKVCVRGGVNCK